MKKLILLSGLLSMLVLTSCKDKAIYKNFNTTYSFKVTVPANSLLSSALFPITMEETNDMQQQYEINDTRKDLIEEVYMNSFLLEVASPSGDDLQFLKSIACYIDSDNQPEMLVAQKDPVPTDVGADFLFDLQSVNLAPYLREDQFSLRSKVVTDESRTHDITLRGTIHFAVKAKIIGFK